METYLTIKHLAPYLPYRLKWSLQEMSTFVMSGITEQILYTESGTVLAWLKHPDLPQALFPLLRPLSDYLEINSEAMILLNCDLPEQIQICDLANKRLLLSEISVSAYVICLENHIDVNRLIPARLAIDINTLSK